MSSCVTRPHAAIVGDMTTPDTVDPYHLYTRPEACEFLRISEKWLDELVKRGDLYSITSGKRRLFPRAALTAYIRGEVFAPHAGVTGDDTSTWPPTPSMFGGIS